MLDTKTAAPAPVEVVTPIKPSEALRLGRLRFPVRVDGYWFDPDNKAAACALGAMHAGWFGNPTWDFDTWDFDIYDNETMRRLNDLGIAEPEEEIGCRFDNAEWDSEDGDAAVLAYLEERGL